MKRLLLLSIILLTACGYPKNDSDKFFHEDGLLREIDTYKNGVLSKVVMYSEDGTLEQIQSYKKGVVSKYEFFREDGTTEQVDTYENGVYKNSQ